MTTGPVTKVSRFVMPPPRHSGKYEVLVELNGRPSIDGVFDEEKLAMERAKYLLAQAKFSLVQVARVNAAGKEEVLFQKAYAGGGKVTTISHIDSSNVCDDVLDVYRFESRMTLLRLLRSYWDEQLVIPAEQLHRYYPLRYLEREAVLFNPSLSRLATLQAPQMGVKVFDRQDQLARLFVRIKELAQEAPTVLDAFPKALVSGGTAGLLAAAANHPPEERDRIVTFAFASVLEPDRDWSAKAATVLRYYDEDDPASVAICDELLAEIVCGREPLKVLIGYAPDLGTALLSLAATLRGVLDDRLPNTDPLLALSGAMGSGGFFRTELALLERIAGALESATPLTRGEAGAETRLFHALLDSLTVDDGYRGGPAMASALTRRAKMALRSAHEDLPFEDAMRRLALRLGTPAARVGYLLDLATSPFGRKRLSVLIEEVANIFNSVSSVAELAPTGMPTQDARARFGDRLRAAGIPRSLANALIARMAGMPTRRLPPTLETRELQKAARDIARLTLTLGDRRVTLPDDGEELLIGRSKSCGILIDVPSASRQHARIEAVGGKFVLTDISRNGTQVIPDGKEQRTLAHGESVVLEHRGAIVIGLLEDGASRTFILWDTRSN